MGIGIGAIAAPPVLLVAMQSLRCCTLRVVWVYGKKSEDSAGQSLRTGVRAWLAHSRQGKGRAANQETGTWSNRAGLARRVRLWLRTGTKRRIRAFVWPT